MLRWLKKLPPESPRDPILDPVLGTLIPRHGEAWSTRLCLGGKDVELLIGADDGPPMSEMIETARDWVREWNVQYPRIVDYLRQEIAPLVEMGESPDPERFDLEAIQIQWSKRPTTCMMYFNYPGDDSRGWHITFDGFKPRGLAFDD